MMENMFVESLQQKTIIIIIKLALLKYKSERTKIML